MVAAVLISTAVAWSQETVQHTVQSKGTWVTWNTETGVITVTPVDKSKDTLEESVADEDVGKMADYDRQEYRPWKNAVNALKSITIADGVTYIGENAFNGFEALDDVSFGNDLEAIGYCAFNASSVPSLDFPISLREIGNEAFGNCQNLTSVIIPDGVETLGASVFFNDRSITTVTIGTGIKSFGEYQFHRCEGLKEVTFLSTTPPTFSIPDYTFHQAEKLEAVYVPAGYGEAYKLVAQNFAWKDLIVDEAVTLWGLADGADGSEAHPFVISTTDGMDLLAKNVNNGADYKGKFFVLSADLDYSNVENRFDPDGQGGYLSNYRAVGVGFVDGTLHNYNGFMGSFDGQGHTIKGIRSFETKEFFSGDMTLYGIFGLIGEGGSISHVTVSASEFSGIGTTGCIAAGNAGTISDCHVTADVSIIANSNSSYFGCISGYNYGTIEGCTNAAGISLAEGVTIIGGTGGIVGINNTGTIKDCVHLSGQIPGSIYIGAITGFNNCGSVINCYYTFEGLPAIGASNHPVAETNVGLARTITLVGDVAVGGTAFDYAEGLTAPAMHLTTYTPDGGSAVNAMMLATAGAEAWLYSTEGAEVGLGYAGTTGEGYWLEEKVTKTSGGDDVTDEVYASCILTVPAYDVTFTASVEDVWGIGQGADGSDEHPYTISTTQGLDLLAQKVNSGTEYEGKFFVLSADLDYSNVKNRFDPDGQGGYLSNYRAVGGLFKRGEYYSYRFKGSFDGGGHTIKGININRSGHQETDNFHGLFGMLGEGGTVSHVTLDESRITGNDNTGGIAGLNDNGSIIDCHVTDGVSIISVQTDNIFHGGIVGRLSGNSSGAIVEGCTSAATISTPDGASRNYYYGGIAGALNYGTIKDCIYLGEQVGGNNFVSAIVGRNNYGSVINCYYTDDSFVGKDSEGNSIALPDGNPALGSSDSPVAETNLGLARAITLDGDVALDGTATNYADGLTDAALYLTAYAPAVDEAGFALALTTGGQSPTTTLYSVADAEVGIKYDGTLPAGAIPMFTVTKSQGGTADVSKTSGLYSFTMPTDGVTVTVLTGTTVEVAAQSWATFCIDQAVSLGDGQTDCGLYTLSAVGTESVTLSEITGTASAGTPLLIWNGSSTAKTIMLNYTTEPATATEHASEFVATVDGIAVSNVSAAAVYVLYHNRFMRTKEGSIPAHRAYIALPTGNAARTLTIGTATGMHMAQGTMQNEADAVFDLSGRKLSDAAGGKLRPGVYIINGKKHVVK